MTQNDRDLQGRWLKGHPGGPGRPRRAVEQEFLAKLSDGVSLDDWAEITAKAVQAAKQGDAQARRWLSMYLLGDGNLLQLAAREQANVTADDDIQAVADDLGGAADVQ